MTSGARYVLDTNMLVSALLFPDSAPGRALLEARSRGNILLSDEVVEEVADVLRRSKFDRYVLPEERDRFLATLVRQAEHAQITETIQVCRDPKDDKWLELAVGGSAAQIVTGDEDLLVLKSFRGIPIVTPAQFLASLEP
jgi:putative PIN family toxin of toxin-antitoxin system